MEAKTGSVRAFFYLYRKILKNRVKKALRKPVTYIYLAFVIWYFGFLFTTFGEGFDSMFDSFGIDKASALTVVLTVLTFFFVPSNLISYSKRKGLVFRQSDIHFLFPAPVNPKRVLLYAHVRGVLLGLLVSGLMTVGGVIWFSMPVWKMAVYFLFSGVVENLLEGSLMILCYGNEKFGKEQMFRFQLLMYAVVGLFVLIGVAVYMKEGAGMSAVAGYLHSSAIQMVPVIGWHIAFLHLFFMGPTAVNVVCSALYFVSVAVLFFMAVRMKCTGEYYEDAIKFAEDYEEARQKGKRGEVAVVGWKKKYGKAEVTYRGSCAKALFYRQLLEYKKNRFFIFGFYTLVCLALGIGMAFFAYREDFGEKAPFIILGVMAYLTFIFASYAGKWGKELSKPYTFLIPDSAFRKLWYATLMEHIRALVDGCLLTLPAGIVTGIPFFQILLIIAAYIGLQACKLYAEVMLEAFLGNLLGNVGKQFARLFFEGIVIAFGAMGAAAGTMLVSLEVGLAVLIVVVGVMTAAMMILAALNFERMESVG